MGLMALFALAAFITACGGSTEAELSASQIEVAEAIEAWGAAMEKEDYDKLWEMLSKEGQNVYARMLTAPGGVKETVGTLRTALDSEFTSPEDKDRIKRDLEKFPTFESLKVMTPQQYYGWRAKREQNPQTRKAVRELMKRSNMAEIVVEGEKATVLWRQKEQERFFMLKEDGKWKVSLAPKEQRELDAAEKREAEAKEKR